MESECFEFLLIISRIMINETNLDEVGTWLSMFISAV